MHDLEKLSDSDLLNSIRDLAFKERELTLQVLHHLREVERRRLHALRGYSSLFEYAVKELNYSEGAAQRRISSMRLLREIPEIESKIESGELSLSVIAQAQTFFRQEPNAPKLEVLQALEGKSSREAERELAVRATHPEKLIPERVRPVSATHSQVSFVASDELVEQIRELQGLLAHSRPGMTIEEAVAFAVSLAVSRLKPKAPKGTCHSADPTSPPASAVEAGTIISSRQSISPPTLAVEPSSITSSAQLISPPTSAVGLDPVPSSDHLALPPTSAVPPKKTSPLSPGARASARVPRSGRYIPAAIKQWVWHRDRGRCTYSDPVSGRACASRHALEYDHVKPFGLGGSSQAGNLRLRCRAHNQATAIRAYGTRQMARFIPGLRKPG